MIDCIVIIGKLCLEMITFALQRTQIADCNEKYLCKWKIYS